MRYADTQKQCTLSGFKKSMMLAIQRMEAHLGPTSRLYLSFMRKVGKRIDAMEEDTFMVAAAVLDPYTHYKLNLCNHTDYATSLTDAIAKILDPVSALSAIDEVSKFRECQGRFGTRLAEEAVARMGPTQWWFQFGGDVPALQKCAMRICSQCVSSSGCERNWSAFALVHTKQRSRLLYDKLHKLVSVRYNLKIRAEEDQEKERDIDKEIDPSALLMDTTMFDETNPIMEWLNEDVEDPIVDGADAASAVFEQIRRLNSSRKASYVGSKGNNKKRKRNDDDENEFLETESEDDEEENEYVDNDIEDDDGVSEDDEDGEQDQLETQMQLEEETQVQVQKEAPTSTGHLETRSGRLIRKKTKNVNSLYS
ncbi:uncharacterized protein LOC119337421 [Triticum dicoccoides]|nr:uncharacterized protein LOC119337421 [Triticum dicoccoides]